MERVGCQFFPKYTRGRPRAPEWFPGWPLWISNSRYNEKDRASIKIKNWSACIPEELRKSNFMATVPFDKAPHALRLHPSPFKQGVMPGARGVTGGIGGALGSYKGAVDGEDEDAISERRAQMPAAAALAMATPGAGMPVKRPVGRPPKNRQVEDYSIVQRPGSRTPHASYEGSPMPLGGGAPYGQAPSTGAYGHVAPLDYSMATMAAAAAGGGASGSSHFPSISPYAGQPRQPLPPRYIPPAQAHQTLYNAGLPPPMTGALSPHVGGSASPMAMGLPAAPLQRMTSGGGPSLLSAAAAASAPPTSLADFARIYGNDEALRRFCEVEELSGVSGEPAPAANPLFAALYCCVR